MRQSLANNISHGSSNGLPLHTLALSNYSAAMVGMLWNMWDERSDMDYGMNYPKWTIQYELFDMDHAKWIIRICETEKGGMKDRVYLFWLKHVNGLNI